MTIYTLEITTKRDLPEDVLVEHIGYALRGIVDPARRKADSQTVKIRVVEVKRPRQHPFEGPEVFDDEPGAKLEEPIRWDGRGYIRGPVTPLSEEQEPWHFQYDLPKVPNPPRGGTSYHVIPFGIDQVVTAIGEDLPYLRELFRAKGAPQDVGEGDWQLTDDDKVGDDV